jgi:pyridoxamine 5'-phosphate oxidase
MNENKDLINSSNDPFDIFKKWFDEAGEKEINDSNAMNLATVSSNNRPTSRMVLLKGYNKKGFIFYTNLNSKKGKSIANNPYVSLNFHWKSLLKQVRIEGKISRVSDQEADEYYNTRPKESRIGAWASNQSEELEERKILEENLEFYRNKFYKGKISRPPHWTGFIVKPRLIEFWQDMPFRLHDRLEFTIVNSQWVGRKLYP